MAEAGDERADDSTGGVRIVKSADRTVALLEYLSAATAPRSLREVAEDLKMPRASTYALLMTLQRRGWVEPAAGGFRLGIRSLRAAAATIEMDETVHATSEVRRELNTELQETIHLARLDGYEVVYMQTLPSPHTLSVLIRPGRRVPTWASALGKALLAMRSWEDVAAILPGRLEPVTSHTITDRDELRKDLERTRRRGYALDKQEVIVGIRCWAVAVRLQAPPLYAISCSVPMARLDSEREQQITKAMMAAGERLAFTPDFGR